jgi:intracellular multiplication protein IcmP
VARSPRAAGAIGSDDYTGFSLILICVGLGILGWACWKLWHAQITTVALGVAHRETQAIAFF